MVDFYAVLEVNNDASQEEIKRSYHRLALRYHPDKAGPEGAAKFKEINTAYEVLSDPQKKSIYDAYGEAGLDAMDNPVAGGAMAALGPTVSILVALLFLFVTAVMVLIFLAFLVSFVDGKLRSWNYVKVFSPLFVVDVVVGVPITLAFVLCLVLSPKAVPIHCLFLAILCGVILTIVIPICKDRNEARMRAGRTDYLKWRVWLIPGYLLSVFVFLVVFFFELPTALYLLKLKSMGLVHLANYVPIGFIFSLLQAACVVIFFALISCRADEVITTNYFVIIGVPIFVGLTLFLINRLVYSILQSYISEVPPEVRAAAEAAEAEANGGEPPVQPAEGGSSGNPMRATSETQEAGGGAAAPAAAAPAEEHPYSTESHQHSNSDERNAQAQHDGDAENSDDNDQPNAASGKNPYAGQHTSCGSITLRTLIACLFAGLVMASTAMIAVRLNYYYNYGTYIGVMSLAKACIPLFFIVGLVVLALLVGSLLVCCGVAAVVVDDAAPPKAEGGEAGNQQEAEEHEMQGGADNSGAAAANNGAGEGEAPAVPHRDVGTTGRLAQSPSAPPQAGTTPPERQPDNERLSDID